MAWRFLRSLKDIRNILQFNSSSTFHVVCENIVWLLKEIIFNNVGKCNNTKFITANKMRCMMYVP